MITITAQQVKELRERTGAGFMDCKRALEEADGDLDRAAAILRERGLAAAARRADRAVREGLIGSYIHTGGRIGVLIEVNCETDFVARTEAFQQLVRNLAIQVAGMRPRWVEPAAIPPEVVEEKRRELAADPAVLAKPESVRPQIVEGQLQKWFQEVCLLEQPYRDTDQTVRELIAQTIAATGENIRVRRFVRYELGEEE
jgi:elongation factor Ts